MTTKVSITQEDIDTIKILQYESPSRISEKQYQDLIDVIQFRINSGKEALPPSEAITVGKDGILGDGHRRLMALKACGVKRVWVIFDNERTGLEIFGNRASSKPITSRHVSEAAKAGMPIDAFPPKQRKNAEALIRLAGEQGYNEVIQSGCSLGIFQSVARVVNFTSHNGDIEFGAMALRWLMKYQMQRNIRGSIEHGDVSAKTLVAAIVACRRLTLA